MSNPVDDGGHSFKARMFTSKAKQFLPKDLNVSPEEGIPSEDAYYRLANLYFHLYGHWPDGYGRTTRKTDEFPYPHNSEAVRVEYDDPVNETYRKAYPASGGIINPGTSMSMRSSPENRP